MINAEADMTGDIGIEIGIVYDEPLNEYFHGRRAKGAGNLELWE